MTTLNRLSINITIFLFAVVGIGGQSWGQSAQNRGATRADHIAALKSGEKAITTVGDAAIFLNAGAGYSLVINPPVIANNKPYVLSGILRRKIKDNYIFESNQIGRPNYYFSVGVDSTTEIESGYQLKYGLEGTVVGLFVDTMEYTTVGGETKNAPAFRALFVGR